MDNIVPAPVGFAIQLFRGAAAAATAATAKAYQTSAGIAAARAVNRLGRELLVRLYRRAEAPGRLSSSEAVALLLTTGGSRPLANLLRTLIARRMALRSLLLLFGSTLQADGCDGPMLSLRRASQASGPFRPRAAFSRGRFDSLASQSSSTDATSVRAP
uniref:Secreted protein n=1 Tax=Macrostomum lignano TaxID=282301 RepID=A0A1I8FN25_9PLAT